MLYIHNCELTHIEQVPPAFQTTNRKNKKMRFEVTHIRFKSPSLKPLSLFKEDKDLFT